MRDIEAHRAHLTQRLRILQGSCEDIVEREKNSDSANFLQEYDRTQHWRHIEATSYALEWLTSEIGYNDTYNELGTAYFRMATLGAGIMAGMCTFREGIGQLVEKSHKEGGEGVAGVFNAFTSYTLGEQTSAFILPLIRTLHLGVSAYKTYKHIHKERLPRKPSHEQKFDTFVCSYKKMLQDQFAQLNQELKGQEKALELLKEQIDENLQQLNSCIENGFAAQKSREEVHKHLSHIKEQKERSRDFHIKMDAHIPSFLQSCDHLLKAACAPDVNGWQTGAQLDPRIVAESPKDYLGFLGENKKIPHPRLLLSIGEALVQLQRQPELPQDYRKSIQEKLQSLQEPIAEILKMFSNEHVALQKTQEALDHWLLPYRNKLHEAAKVASSLQQTRLDMALQRSAANRQSLLEQSHFAHQRFQVPMLVHTPLPNPEEGITDLCEQLRERVKNLEHKYITALGGVFTFGAMIPPLIVPTAIMAVPVSALFWYTRPPLPSLAKDLNKANDLTKRMQTTIFSNTQTAPTSLNIPWEKNCLIVPQSLDMEVESSDGKPRFVAIHMPIKLDLALEVTDKLIHNSKLEKESKHVIEATVRFFLDEDHTVSTQFSGRSWVQKEDIPSIRAVFDTSLSEDNPYQSEEAYNSALTKMYRKYLSADPCEEGEVPVPPIKGRMPSLVLPQELLEIMDKDLVFPRLLMSLTDKGWLLPCYEYRDSSFYLSIIHRSPDKTETRFSSYKLFSFCEMSAKALQGEGSELQLLVHALYGGRFGLGMPGFRSYELKSKKALSPVDHPYHGFFEELKQNPRESVHFTMKTFGQEALQKQPLEEELTNYGEFLKIELLSGIEQLDKETKQSKGFGTYREDYYRSIAWTRATRSVGRGEDGRFSLDILLQNFTESGLPEPDSCTLQDALESRPMLGELSNRLGKLPNSRTLQRLQTLHSEI